MTEYHTARAVNACIDQWLGSEGHLQDYSVTAQTTKGISNYAFYVELAAGFRATEENVRDIAARLDRELCKANDYYWSNGRKAETLGPVRVNFVAPGTFESLNHLQDQASEGTVTSQIKTPRIIDRPAQLELLENAVFLSTTGQDTRYEPEPLSRTM